jgi:homoserine O-acetyltransferase/O-succinyltransferase
VPPSTPDPAPRRYAEFGPLDLELGGQLPAVRLAYESWGQPRRDDHGQITNAVLVLHALTGDAHVVGPIGPGQPTPGWWDGLIGADRALDPDEWWVVAANVLGGCQGSTGPASSAPDGQAWGSRFPRITVRDQVAAELRLVDHLGIGPLAAVIGGSMGGMRALEWAIGHPARVRSALVLAVGAYATADEIATQTAQLVAIRSDPGWQGGDYHGRGPGPVAGLGLARRIAHLTYRSEVELETRFGRLPQAGEDPLAGGRFAIQSYLDHHAAKLVGRFDAGTYAALTDAMNTHDVGRGRGGVEAALSAITAPVVVAGIDSDRLYPLRLQQELADGIPTCAGLDVVSSPYGHDGFLIEIEAVSDLVRRTLAVSQAAERSVTG